jgi:hypothetical protein
MQVFQTMFDAKTRAEFTSSERNIFGHRQQSHLIKEGDIVLLQDLTEKSVFAIARMGKFENGSVMREHSLLDTEIYNNSIYNKFEFAIAEVKILPKDISFTDLASLLGIDNTVRNNITKGTPMNFRRLFYEGNKSEEVMKRLKIWVNTIIQ